MQDTGYGKVEIWGCSIMIKQMFNMIEHSFSIPVKSGNGFLLNRKNYSTERSDLDFYGKEGK
jgi:hypothetical protein